ncbi:hypothetical protein Tco_0079049 [Tanacetum coccineum]
MYLAILMDIIVLFHDNELLEYMDVHDNDDSESSQPSWGKLWEVRYSTSLSMLCVKYSAYLRRIIADILHVPPELKTLKIQAGVQVSRPEEVRRHLQHWKRFGRLYFVVYVLVRNIEFHYEAYMAHSNTNAHLRHYKKILLAFKSRYVEGLNKFLTNLNTVHEAVKEDPALNVKVLVATHAYVNNSSNLT